MEMSLKDTGSMIRTVKAHIIHSRDVVFDETSLGIEGEQQENVAQDTMVYLIS